MTVDDMKSLGDDSMKMDVTHDEKGEYNRNSLGKSFPVPDSDGFVSFWVFSAPSHISSELIIQPQQVKEYYSQPDNVDINRQPVTAG